MLRKIMFNLVYLGRPIWDTGVSPPELMDFIATHPAGRALDMGCGTGTNAITLAKHSWTVTGVDFTRRAIRKARQKARLYHVQVDLRVADVTRLRELSGPFDLIFDLGCYHLLSSGQRQPYLANVDRLIADDGTFLLYTFIKPNSESVDPGSTEGELQALNQVLEIVNRIDGTERGFRPSAWLTAKKRM